MSNTLVRAFNAAFIRVVDVGEWQSTVTQYAKPFVQVGTCSATPTQYTFPVVSALGAGDVLKKVLDRGTLRVAGFQADWGTDGNYTKATPTGFWPDMLDALVAKIRIQYSKPNLQIARVYFGSSQAVLDALTAGESAPVSQQADMTEPYMFVGSTYTASNGDTFFRNEKFHAMCTIGGSQHTVITDKNDGITSATALNSHISGSSSTVKVGALTEGNYHQYRPVIASAASWSYKTVKSVASSTLMDTIVGNLADNLEVQTEFTLDSTQMLVGWTVASVKPAGAASATLVKTKAELATARAATGFAFPVEVNFDHFVDTAHMITGVLNGQIKAGVASSTASFYSDTRLNAFSLSLVSPQSALFRMDEVGTTMSAAALSVPAVSGSAVLALLVAMALA